MSRLSTFAAGLLLAGCVLPAADAQTRPDTLRLPEARVEATRSARGGATAPFSIAVVPRGTAERASDAGATLETALRRVPGLYAANRENPSQGERLVVRGLGYRSAFGVRGVQVVLDGVPLTLADGQAVLGIADPAFVRQAEIVRGPASALWGNGSGGVLFLSTIPEAVPDASVRAVGGSFGLVRAEAEAAVPLGAHRAGLSVSRTSGQGYRDYSGFETVRARGFGDIRLSPAAQLRLIAAVEDAPRLDNPGALTLAELDADRRQADARYTATASGKASRQAQAAATLRADAGPTALSATVYGVARDLDNPLPFAYVAVDRLAGGTRLAAERDVGGARLTLGSDLAIQHDRRTNRPNEAGQPGGALLLDQAETVAQAAAFVRLRVPFAALGLPGVAAEGALRADRVGFTARDARLDDGDQSGRRVLGALSPQVGLTARVGPHLLFTSVSTAFETPTTTELANRPDGSGGFNPDVGPQRTLGAEAGARGVAGPLLYDVAVYALAVRDGLTPAEGADGRTYYVNRARTRHAGAEAFAEWRLRPDATAVLTYTWSRLRFGSGSESLSGATVEGLTLPGVPAHRLAARVQLARGGLFVAPEAVVTSGVFADDLNTVRTRASVLADVAVGHTGVTVGGVRLRPVVRVQNVFDTRAVGSVVVNAQAGRYFEPAAARGVQVGVGVAL